VLGTGILAIAGPASPDASKYFRSDRLGHEYFSAEKSHGPDSRRRAPSCKSCPEHRKIG